jgi:hypothetical protein
MKKILFFIFLGLSMQTAHSQAVQNFKVKNASNEKDRTMMLDILRADLYQNVKQELVFVVDHFKVAGNYAWYYCCIVTSLFKKSNNKWYIVESGAFGTDVWYGAIAMRYPNVPKSIFTPMARGTY